MAAAAVLPAAAALAGESHAVEDSLALRDLAEVCRGVEWESRVLRSAEELAVVSRDHLESAAVRVQEPAWALVDQPESAGAHVQVPVQELVDHLESVAERVQEPAWVLVDLPESVEVRDPVRVAAVLQRIMRHRIADSSIVFSDFLRIQVCTA